MDISPLTRTMASLEGLAIGDAFGQCFFVLHDSVEGLIAQRALPAAPWRYTDDTEMALSVVKVLRQCGRVSFGEWDWHFCTGYRALRALVHGATSRPL